ncbi:MAG: histidine kinase dimerization/phospho-acceptor domain-containing protein, partial [Candidatus Competibacteraceae bacterium]|nr:histidine kinase dimerization/phospho-acceptor domain-containing protein [Candidatus Competibacteraceae bacterium]
MMPFKTPVTLRQALAMAGLIGTVLLAAAIMVMVQGELVRHLRADLEADGRRIAERLARDSRLAVMLEVADNVQPSVDLALAFPNVAGVAVYTRERQPLVDRLTDAGHFAKAGPLADAERLTNRLPPLSATRPLEETETHLVLLSPVLVDSTPEAHRLPDSDLERAEGVNRPVESTELQGWVVVQMSKATLHGTVDSVLWNVLLLTLGVALVVYLALALFVGWITAPLQQLARVMTDPATVTRYTQAPVRGSQEARHMARAFNTLISAFAEVNRRLVALNAALDARVTERTRALEQANAELRRASEAKSMFLSRISHELRTPLQGVILSADLLTRSRRLENDQRRIVQTIDSSATLLLGLIDNVLDLARIEAGKLALKQIPFDL